ncbi:hypothetical protein KAI68_08540, partial [bacterium]|nr:hypothetical protein [bacterium]
RLKRKQENGFLLSRLCHKSIFGSRRLSCPPLEEACEKSPTITQPKGYGYHIKILIVTQSVHRMKKEQEIQFGNSLNL